jgi:hypothetical membrane protein
MEDDMPRNRVSLRLAGLCGMAGPVISSVLLFHAIAVSPWFDWHRNSLSDIGISANALWFNAAVIIQGLFSLVAVLGIRHWMGPGRWARAGSAALLISSVALSLVGVFPKSHGGLHFAVAAAHFVLSPLGLALLGVAMRHKGLVVPAALTVSAAVAAFLSIAGLPAGGYAVPELVAGLFAQAWTYAMGVQLLLGGPPQRI